MVHCTLVRNPVLSTAAGSWVQTVSGLEFEALEPGQPLQNRKALDTSRRLKPQAHQLLQANQPSANQEVVCI